MTGHAGEILVKAMGSRLAGQGTYNDPMGRSKPKLENLEPRTQDLARFSNSSLFQAEPRKMMWRCDEIVTFVPSSRKIVRFLEVPKETFSKPGSVTSNLKCDVLWRKCDVTSFCHRPSLEIIIDLLIGFPINNIISLFSSPSLTQSNPGPGSGNISAWNDLVP